jgi:DNA-directed RNA polymerase
MNLEAQMKWEKELSTRGAMRYNENQQRLRNSGEADRTDGAQYLLKERLEEVVVHLKKSTEKLTGRGAKYTRLLRLVTPNEDDFHKIAFMGVQVAFQKTQMDKQNTLMKTTIEIGRRIEADLKCRMFEAQYPAYYYTLTKSLKEQNVTDYMHKHNVYMQMFNKFEDLEWKPFDVEVQSHLGLRVLDSVLKVFGDVLEKRKIREFTKTVWRMFTTPAFDEWLHTFENARALMNPTRLPCKIPPRAWDASGSGGYYSHELSSQTKFVKTKSKEHRKFVQAHDPAAHRKAVNSMQRTPWKVNTRVLDVQKDIYTRGLGIGLPSNETVVVPTFPEHLQEIPKEELTEAQKVEVGDWKMSAKSAYSREKKRQSAVIAFMQSFKTAQELRDWEEFYYVYTCDFRGRIYCATSGLSPQGADTAKGVIQFARSERLGVSGVKWLAVQGANTYGVDKVSYEDRVTWVHENRTHIEHTVSDPVGSREWWGGADKPYQFLAFCYEWADCDYGRNTNAQSSIPVGLDGSCNGLQHFSAMLRDEVGARATNLIKSEVPEDIYQDVADTCKAFLRTVDDPRARKWIQVGLSRKLAKRPVMTLPYGATQTSAREYIFEWCQDYWSDFDLDEKECWEYAKYLTPYLWSAIGSTVTAATSGMAWLKKNVGKEYCKWLTPLNFPVYQYYKDVPVIVVETKLCGGVRLQLKVQDYDYYGDPKTSQQRSGIAPNFVHSIDSTHMVMTINSTDFRCYAMIHDDFGTHAGNTEVLFKAIRTSFFNLYSNHEPLREWGEQVGADLTTLPPMGDYKINDIKDATYFFG